MSRSHLLIIGIYGFLIVLISCQTDKLFEDTNFKPPGNESRQIVGGGHVVYYACSARLYKKTNFEGKYNTLWTKPKGDCIPFPTDYDNQVRSIDTFDLCVVLWTRSDCTGKAMRLRRYDFGTYDLSLVGFAEIASSLQVCKGVDKHDKDAIRPATLDSEYNVENHPDSN